MGPAGAGQGSRRDFLRMLAVTVAVPDKRGLLVLPVRRVMDARARCTPEQFRHFWWDVWPEAVRDFRRGGIALECTDARGEIRRSAAGRPIFVGLERGVINVVITDHIPANWDNGRASAGVTAFYEGYHLCVIAVSYAHGDQVPFVSTNTCVHELLHALLQDVYVTRPKWYQAGGRELRIDWYATRLRLFGDGAAVRQSAESYLARVKRPLGR